MLYKLTDKNWETRNNTKWGYNITHEVSGKGALCSKGWLHAYEDLNIAAFLNPIHANFNPCVAWEAEGVVGLRDGQLKVGCSKLTTMRLIELPSITTTQRVFFAISCAKTVYCDSQFITWADKWITGADRSADAAALAAAWAARTAEAAAEAAEARAAAAAWAARTAKAAAAAAEARAAAASTLDLFVIAARAVEFER